MTVVSIVLMTVDHRFNHLNATRAVMGMVVYPVQYLVNLPVKMGFRLSEAVSSRNHLKAQNEALREQHLLYRTRLQKLSALRKENTRLRELLESSRRFEEERLEIAELLAVDMDPYKQQVVLDKGASDGVYVGQPLLDARGVMGQVVRVNPWSATAILISDPSHALPVQVDRNGLRTIAVGTGNPEALNLLYLPNSADIRVGDTVSTSGLGGAYPADYPVAEVTGVRKVTGEPFAFVEARPLAQLDRSRNVLLLWARGNERTARQAEAPPTTGPADESTAPTPSGATLLESSAPAVMAPQ